MLEILINDGDDTLGLSILYYSLKHIKLKENEKKQILIKFKKLLPRLNKDTPYIINKLLPYGEHIIEYSNINIIVKYTKLGNPKEFGHFRGFYSEIKLICESDNSEEILEKFIDESIEYYIKNILDRKKTEGKINCYIYDDGFWSILSKIPKRNSKSLCLPNNLVKDTLKDMKDFLSQETEEKYLDLGIPYKKNYLFHGLPGTGKTSLVYTVASELNMHVAIINFDVKLTDNELMKSMKKIPDDAILLLEDIDVLFQDRKKNDDKNMISFSGLLNALDGIAHQEKLITVLTTNYKCALDSALKRPGRIDKQIRFDYATKEQIIGLYSKFFPECSKVNDFYKLVKNKKFTTATLQQFLFYNLYNQDTIFEKIDDFYDMCNEHNYDESSKNLYT